MAEPDDVTPNPNMSPVSEVVQDGTGLPPGTIHHGNGLKSKWSGSAEGYAPPNPPIEVVPDHNPNDPSDPDWRVKQQRTGRDYGWFSDKAAAIERATSIAKEHKTELIVKNADGSIGKGHSSRSSYGNDPTRSPG